MDDRSKTRLAEQAATLFQQGRLAEARALCQQLLAADPSHFDGLHVLGVISCREGRPDRGLELLERAVSLNPQHSQAHNNRGMALLQLGRLDEALGSFTRAAELNPNSFIALQNQARVFHQLKRFDEAVGSFDAVTRLKPDDAEAHFMRAGALIALKRASEAIESLDKAIRLRPDFAEAYSNLGNLQRTLGRYEAAASNLDKAIELAPDFAVAHYNRAMLMGALKRYPEALASYDKAIEHSPGERGFHLAKVSTYEELGEIGLAVETLRAAEQHLRGDPAIRFHLSRLGADAAPAAPPEAYIRTLFDDYADNFETHLVSQLQYRVPELIGERLFRHTPARPLDILDLGCGTGLMGPVVANAKRRLVGVDLSPNMFGKARDRHAYDELHVADIIEFLSAASGRFDVVLAADVIIYVGDLFPILSGVHRVLVPSGLFAFSVERSEEGDFALNRSGRYSHSKAYVEGLAHRIGFQIVGQEDVVLRYQDGAPVDGFITILRTLATEIADGSPR